MSVVEVLAIFHLDSCSVFIVIDLNSTVGVGSCVRLKRRLLNKRVLIENVLDVAECTRVNQQRDTTYLPLLLLQDVAD